MADDPDTWDADNLITREIRRDIRGDLLRLARGTPAAGRNWLSLKEIAQAYARRPGTLEHDPEKFKAAVARLRQCIHEGRFNDRPGRCRIADVSDRQYEGFRYDRKWAVDPDYFSRMVGYDDLWMSRADCVAWFARWGIPLPAELGLPLPSADAPSAAAREAVDASGNASNVEDHAVEALKLVLQGDKNLKRKDAQEWLGRNGYVVSDRGFQYRVWPNARKLAGLSTKARSGPKPRS